MKKISPIEKMLFISIAFTMILLLTRYFYTGSLLYGFYIWNTFLAILPLFFSRKLVRQEQMTFKSVFLIGGWLLFFPNAPYMLTDIFHYTFRPPVPNWFDLLLVTSAAWNGLLLGIISLMQVELFLSAHMKATVVRVLIMLSMVLCGYGVYIGRFLRFNSWDVFTSPVALARASAFHILHPSLNIKLWGFTFLFASMYAILYFTLKQMRLKAE